MSSHRSKPTFEASRELDSLAPAAAPGSLAEEVAAIGDALVEPLPVPRRRRRVWPILFVLALLAGGGAIGWRWWTSRKEGTRVERATYVVQRADLPIVITETGSLDALHSEVIKSKVEGQATIISLVDEGSIVTDEEVAEGKILCELDSADLRERLTQQKLTFSTAEATFMQAKEAYDIEKSEGESKVKQGELNVKFGRMDLEEYVGKALADDALAGSIDLLKLAVQLHGEAVEHRKRVEAEVARSLAEVGRALQGVETEADNPKSSGSGSDASGASPASPRVEADVSEPGSQAFRLGGLALQRTRKLEADIGLAYEEFKRAADKVVSYAGLKRLGVKSSQQLEAEQLGLMRQEITLDQALAARQLFLRYEFPKQAEAFLSLYQERGKELERIIARAHSALSKAEVELKSADAKYVLQKKQLDKLQKQIEHCTIRATKPGLVVYGTTGWDHHNRTPIEVGSSVHERQVIIKMPDIASLAVEAKIHESVVDKVKVGMPVRIKVDAFPNLAVTGKVLKLAVLPSSQSNWLNPDLKEYDTQISIDGEKAGLKPGMSAALEIDVKILKSVLQVPVQAVGSRDGKTVAYIVRPDGSEESRGIEVGESNDKMVEVTGGLREGERILLEAPQIALASEEEKDAEKKKEKEKEEGGEGEERLDSPPPARPSAAGPPTGRSGGPGEKRGPRKRSPGGQGGAKAPAERPNKPPAS